MNDEAATQLYRNRILKYVFFRPKMHVGRFSVVVGFLDQERGCLGFTLPPIKNPCASVAVAPRVYPSGTAYYGV